ncbi:MAG: DUF1549 domain-containing protein [Pirellulaceae bacterium]
MTRSFADKTMILWLRWAIPLVLVLSATFTGPLLANDDEPVSYASDVRPLLAANCFGCHQGARHEGGYVMTAFDALLGGGDSGSPAIVPGNPDESYLLDLITAHDGQAEMPPTGLPLSDDAVETIRTWIADGAVNDYQKQVAVYDRENPPGYSRLPNITAVDWSPDGRWLAIGGFHEILIYDAAQVMNGDSPALANRLIGMSSRIESVRFSPDSARLAVSGGNPAEFGEVQIWDLAGGSLELSRVVSHDTVYGINWSPDGKLVAFGCTDTTVRAINAESGEQVLYQSAHEDWVRDTVFSVDGSQLVSVGRDMTCKLIEVPTQRFIDNVTSITPGVLKGGIASVARHPARDEIVIGGADGVPKVYRMNRITKRVIGDDANLIRLLPAVNGRIQSVDVSPDGLRIAAVSSLDGEGSLHVYSYEFDPAVSDELKAVLSKLPGSWSAAERKLVDDYIHADVREVAKASVPESGLYAVAFHPDNKTLAAAGADGRIRVFETETCQLLTQFDPVEATEAVVAAEVDWRFKSKAASQRPGDEPDTVASLTVSPANIKFTSPTDYVQLVVQAELVDGSSIDVTPFISLNTDASVISIEGSLIQPTGNGNTELVIDMAGQSHSVPVAVDMEMAFQPDFRRDVNPVLTKLGCNAGTCHGSADGKMGFKLSLRGYDPLFDVRAFTDDMGSRRTSLAAPSDSLMLTKPTATVPHSGGQLLTLEDKYYQLVHGWISHGAELNTDSPRVASIQLFPENPVLGDSGASQQMRLVATYEDGTERDVTREAFIEVGNMEIASIDDSVVEALRRGETPVLARYDGAFTATTLTVMGRRDGYAWTEPESWTDIDRLVADKWQRMKITPSDLCSDTEFIRRVYLDLTGLPPSADEVTKFLADERPTRQKRDELIDSLIGSDSFVEHWSNKWADLMQVNRKYLGEDGAKAMRDWIREQVRENTPYDELAWDILTASGSNRDNPAASYFKIHRTPEDTMENTTHLFLATRFNCNKCHDHPFERWTQDQYYETAAFFAQVSLDRDPASGKQTIGGSAVESAKPLYEIVADSDSGDVTHDRTGEITAPAFPFDCDFNVNDNASRREKLAAWITSPDNPYFATSYVNRVWGYMLGTGLIEPLDDIRAGNPPTNPQLLEYLREEFINSDFDSRHIIRLICQSRVYQLSIETNEYNRDDQLNYSHAQARRLPAEVLFDSIHFVTGSQLQIPGVEPGTRAAALPDAGAKLPSGFLTTLGRPARESVCECERSSELQLGSVLALVSGPDVARAIDDPNSELAQLVTTQSDDRELIRQIYLRILNRLANDEEVDLTLSTFGTIATDHQTLVEQRDARRKLVDKQLPGREAERLQAIADAVAELQDAITRLDPELLLKEAAQEQAVAETKAALDEYVASADGFHAWQRRQLESVHWYPVTVSGLDSTVDRPYQVLEDRSVLLQEKSGKDIYTVTTHTDLTGVSAIRLEVLPHDSLAAQGPGLAENGNLVLTEFEIEVAHPDRPDQWQKLEFESVLANFEQPDYPIAHSINGVTDNNQGWALLGSIGKTSWATFQLKLPFGYSAGTLLRFRLHHAYDDQHQIGRFRISLTKNHESVGLGLPEFLLAELAKPAAERADDTETQLTNAFRQSDPRFAELDAAYQAASEPLMIDPEIVRLREKLERVGKPLAEDAELLQLNQDVEMSQQQLENERLTAAQDLAWALINSPAFLFNH